MSREWQELFELTTWICMGFSVIALSVVNFY